MKTYVSKVIGLSAAVFLMASSQSFAQSKTPAELNNSWGNVSPSLTTKGRIGILNQRFAGQLGGGKAESSWNEKAIRNGIAQYEDGPRAYLDDGFTALVEEYVKAFSELNLDMELGAVPMRLLNIPADQRQTESAPVYSNGTLAHTFYGATAGVNGANARSQSIPELNRPAGTNLRVILSPDLNNKEGMAGDIDESYQDAPLNPVLIDNRNPRTLKRSVAIANEGLEYYGQLSEVLEEDELESGYPFYVFVGQDEDGNNLYRDTMKTWMDDEGVYHQYVQTSTTVDQQGRVISAEVSKYESARAGADHLHWENPVVLKSENHVVLTFGQGFIKRYDSIEDVPMQELEQAQALYISPFALGALMKRLNPKLSIEGPKTIKSRVKELYEAAGKKLSSAATIAPEVNGILNIDSVNPVHPAHCATEA